MSTPTVRPTSGRVVDLLAWARAQLSDAGVASPDSDAAWLLAHVAGVERGRLAILDDLSESDVAAYVDMIEARRMRRPLQHLMGSAAFRTVELLVGDGVFVPRPETELLAEWAIAIAPQRDCLIADFCSGSGALAIALATELPRARVIAVEHSPAALAWLRRNVEAQPADVAGRITVVEADVTDLTELTAAIPLASLDVIVSNPPYVPEGTLVAPEVETDPHDAVFAGPDGMSVIRPMVPVLAALCADGGAVGIEHDDTTASQVSEVISAGGAFTDVVEHDDLAGLPRFVTACRVPGAHRARMKDVEGSKKWASEATGDQ